MKASQAGWPVIIAATVALSLLAGSWGCGKKGWPGPQLEQDRFQWAQIQHQRYEHCLDARALVDGAAANLRFVTLEWMKMESPEDCPGCPFTASGRVRLDEASSEFKRQNGVIRILFCGWDSDVSYRWRLVGANRHSGLEATTSPVQLSR